MKLKLFQISGFNDKFISVTDLDMISIYNLQRSIMETIYDCLNFRCRTSILMDSIQTGIEFELLKIFSDLIFIAIYLELFFKK